jgi:plasmid maintenance system antidote protein VapI
MSSITPAEEYLSDRTNMRLYQQERAIYETTELMEEAIEHSGVTRGELAHRLGRTKGWVTQLLEADANKTIRTVADVFAVLGYEFHVSFQPIVVQKEMPFQVLHFQIWEDKAQTEDWKISATPLRLLETG